MMNGYSTYEIKRNGLLQQVKLYGYCPDVSNLSEIEWEVREVFSAGALNWEPLGAVGYSVDPYKAAEKILAEHYGYAKMIEPHYTWRPRIRY